MLKRIFIIALFLFAMCENCFAWHHCNGGYAYVEANCIATWDTTNTKSWTSEDVYYILWAEDERTMYLITHGYSSCKAYNPNLNMEGGEAADYLFNMNNDEMRHYKGQVDKVVYLCCYPYSVNYADTQRSAYFNCPVTVLDEHKNYNYDVYIDLDTAPHLTTSGAMNIVLVELRKSSHMRTKVGAGGLADPKYCHEPYNPNDPLIPRWIDKTTGKINQKGK